MTKFLNSVFVVKEMCPSEHVFASLSVTANHGHFQSKFAILIGHTF